MVENTEGGLKPVVLKGNIRGRAVKIKAQKMGVARKEGSNGRTECRAEEAVGAGRIESGRQ